MIEKFQHVKNPLTIIGLFAAVTEVSGTAVLPFIQTDYQLTYLWFLILFPMCLIILFFATLNFNNKVLYAPSDYSDEANFMKLLDRPSYEEQSRKIKEEIGAILPDADDGVSVFEAQQGHRLLAQNYILARQLVCYKLMNELKISITPGLVFDLGEERVLYDGVAMEGGIVHAFDIKHMSRTSGFSEGLEMTGHITEKVSEYIRKKQNAELFYHLIAVINDPDISEIELQKNLEKGLKAYKTKFEVRVYKLERLFEEFKNRAQHS